MSAVSAAAGVGWRGSVARLGVSRCRAPSLRSRLGRAELLQVPHARGQPAGQYGKLVNERRVGGPRGGGVYSGQRR